MSAQPNNGWGPINTVTQLPPGDTAPQQASAQAGQGQAVHFDASGNVARNDGATPGLICAGVAYPGKLSALSTIAGASALMVHQGLGGGQAASTESGDGFTAADVLTPCFDAGDGVPGKLSNFEGDNRSILGVVLGVDEKGDPRVWAGPVASAVARSLLIANAFPHAWFTITDAAASTTTAERAIPSSKIHGIINAVEFVGAAVAANDTDYVTVTIKRYSLADAYASGVTVATYDSRAANQGAIAAFTPAAFLLSATAANLEKLETDRFTLTVAKGGSGKQLIGEFMVNGKVI